MTRTCHSLFTSRLLRSLVTVHLLLSSSGRECPFVQECALQNRLVLSKCICVATRLRRLVEGPGRLRFSWINDSEKDLSVVRRHTSSRTAPPSCCSECHQLAKFRQSSFAWVFRRSTLSLDIRLPYVKATHSQPRAMRLDAPQRQCRQLGVAVRQSIRSIDCQIVNSHTAPAEALEASPPRITRAAQA